MQLQFCKNSFKNCTKKSQKFHNIISNIRWPTIRNKFVLPRVNSEWVFDCNISFMLSNCCLHLDFRLKKEKRMKTWKKLSTHTHYTQTQSFISHANGKTRTRKNTHENLYPELTGINYYSSHHLKKTENTNKKTKFCVFFPWYYKQRHPIMKTKLLRVTKKKKE